jgi:DNA-binding GntR family transcriptional regulator
MKDPSDNFDNGAAPRDRDGDRERSKGEDAFACLVAALRSGELRSGQFISMPGLVEIVGLPLAATREAVKRAEAQGLVEVLPKRGVMVMDAGARATRDCLDMRAALDQEGARRLIAAGRALPLSDLRAAHHSVLEAARRDPTAPGLPSRAIATDLTLHDAMASGLGNPLLAGAYDVNRNRIAVIQNTRPFLADRIVSAMEEHMAIMAALEAGDATEAVAAIAWHSRQTLRWWGVPEADAAPVTAPDAPRAALASPASRA